MIFIRLTFPKRITQVSLFSIHAALLAQPGEIHEELLVSVAYSAGRSAQHRAAYWYLWQYVQDYCNRNEVRSACSTRTWLLWCIHGPDSHLHPADVEGYVD